MAAAELRKYTEAGLDGLSLRHGIEDADKLMPCRFDSFDNLVSKLGILAIESLRGATALAKSEVLGAGSGDYRDSSSSSDLSHHSAHGCGATIDKENFADGSNGLDRRIRQAKSWCADARHGDSGLFQRQGAHRRFESKGNDNALGERDLVGKDGCFRGWDNSVVGKSSVLWSPTDQSNGVTA